jgi:ATP-dependent helicase/DNAse subunit B
MDLHLYRNAEDRWHDLRAATQQQGAVLAINFLTISELVEKLAPDVEVASIGQQVAAIRTAVRSGTNTRHTLEAIRLLKSAGVGGRESELVRIYDAALRDAAAVHPQDRIQLAAARVREKAAPWLQRFSRVVLHTVYDPTEAEFTLISSLIEAFADGGAVVLFNTTANVKPTQFAEWTWQRFVRDELLAERTFPEFCRPSSPNSALIERLFAFHSSAESLDPLPSLRIAQATGRYNEAEFIGSEIAGLLAGGAKAKDIAVVVRHIETYGEMLEDVFRRYRIPHNFQTGVPLLRIPFIKYWFSLLELISSERQRDTLARVLASSYFEPRLAPETDITRELVNLGYIDRHQLSASDLARRRSSSLTPELHRLETWLDAMSEARKTAPEWLAEFSTPLGLTVRDSEAWQALSDEISSLGAFGGVMPVEEFRALAFDICAIRTIDRAPLQPETVGSSCVSVFHPISLGSRTYKWIFAPGMVDGEFPASAPGNPLLPEEALEILNKSLWPRRVQTPRDQYRREPLYLFMLLDSASERTTLTFPTATINGDPIVPSMYVAEINRHFSSDVVEKLARELPVREVGECRRRIASAWQNGLLGQADARQLLGEDLTARIGRERRGWLRSDLSRGTVRAESAWHPSELNSLLTCPFVFLAKHRLRLRAEELPEFEVAPVEIGKLAHEILRIFYSSAIPLSETAALEKMRAIIAQRLADADVSGQGRSVVFDPSLWKIRRKQLVAALEQYVRFAIRDALEGFETQTQYLDSPLPPAQLGPVLVAGRPDHVAVRRLAGRIEAIRVDDFKYSAASAATGKLLKESFQIPVYAHLASQALHADESTQIEGRYLLLRSPSTPVVAQSIDGLLLAEVGERIGSLVDKVVEGRLHPEPSDRQDCFNCDFRRLCRLYGA